MNVTNGYTIINTRYWGEAWTDSAVDTFNKKSFEAQLFPG